MKPYSIAASLALLLATLPCGADQAFKITTKRSDDKVEVKSDENKRTFVIRSPFGVSSATIERIADEWPDKMVIQLRLKGLEYLKLSTEKLKLEAAVSSQNADVRLWMDGKEDSLLNSKSPYWMELRIVDSEGRPTNASALNDRCCFEMQLPPKFLQGNPKSFSVEWIDFYRN